MSLKIDDIEVPSFFYGTAWKEERTAALTEQALAAGFRAIDTANQRKHYFEEAVGQGVCAFLRNSGVAREKIFLQTKFTYARGQDHRKPYDERAPYPEQVRQSFASSLDHLGVIYLDSYVLHGPFSGAGISHEDREVWGAMEELQRSGKVRLLGVSNVSLEQLKELHTFARVKPRFAQIRTYARNGWEKERRDFCSAHGILFQCFSLLTANHAELQSALVLGLAKKYGMTPSQVLFRFALHRGMVPLTGTSSAEHMRQDLEAHAFTLTEEELRQIEMHSLPRP